MSASVVRGPVAVLSAGIARIPRLSAMLGAPIVTGRAAARPGQPVAAVAGWGHRPTARSAMALARKLGLPYLALEDGFLRSVGVGAAEPPLSLVLDDVGVYYDASAPSRLESLIGRTLSSEQHRRAQGLIAGWQRERLSKYNQARDFDGALPDRYVLVADQTFGDASIRDGLADAASFTRMLDAALDEHPTCTVLLKVHPEVALGRKRGHFDRLTAGQASRVMVLATDAHAATLIAHAQAVYTVTSQVGFEALMWQRPVRTFGMPFYAGWGLTGDAQAAPPRRGPATLEQLVHASLVDYPRYVDPETGARCEAERIIEHLGLQRRMRQRFAQTVHALGFSRWKRPIARAFLQGSQVRFVRRAQQVPAGGTLVVWGRKPIRGTATSNVGRVHLEDGFLRSVGLGANFVAPLSWSMDQRGIYFDATGPSDLEHLLQTGVFEPALLSRASGLRERIVQHGLTKYNVGGSRWQRPASARRVILVPGQVESDASIRFGASGIRTNVGLLQAVRERNPDAYVIYKPHPDVVAGLRSTGQNEAAAQRWCDQIVTDVAMNVMLAGVDEVHVLTSLAGFEALLRGRSVVTYGQPFYAGWGLTRDEAPPVRRNRRLTLDELVAATLILYPTYVSRVSGRFTTPERALDELLAWQGERTASRPGWSMMVRWFARLRQHAGRA